MATLYLDFSGGNDANDATSFANRVKTVTSGITAARHTAGDTIRTMKSEDPVSLGISAAWTNKSNTVTLASALTTNIYLDGAWTASTNVTCTTSTTRKEGSNSSSNAIASAFTTGKASYFATGTLDLSSYNKISFWIRANGAVASGVLRIDLCSDTAGATPVNSLTINEALTTNNWKCITIDNGAGLGASIQSVALYCVSDPGTVTILLDNIIACNALTLTCLISKNSSATSKEFYPIQSINGTTVKLDSHSDSSAADTIAGYYGTTETVTTYKREPVRIASGQTVQEGGSSTAQSLFSGGWDATNMTTQNGLTFIDLGDDSNNVFTNSSSYVSLERIITVRGSAGISSTGGGSALTDCGSIAKGATSGTAGGGIHISSVGHLLTNCYIGNGNGVGITTSSSSGFIRAVGCICNNMQTAGVFDNSGTSMIFFENLVTNNCLNYGVYIPGGGNGIYTNLTAKDNGAYGIFLDGGVARVEGITTSGNATTGVACVRGTLLVSDTACTDTQPFNGGQYGRVCVSRLGGDPLVMGIYETGAGAIVIQNDTSTVHSPATRGVKYSPQATYHTANNPLRHEMFAFAVESTGTLSVSAYFRRTSTNVGAKLVLRAGQVDGITTTQETSMTAAINTWEKLTVSGSPTEKVPLVVEVHTWQISGSGDIYVSDWTETSQS